LDIWETPFLFSSWKEDNDTSSSSEESNEDKAATMMTLLQGLLSKKNGKKMHPSKSLRFFIAEEEKLLTSIECPQGRDPLPWVSEFSLNKFEYTGHPSVEDQSDSTD
jgi:hypothetical protein